MAILRNALDALTAVLFAAPCRICDAPLLTASLIPVCMDCFGKMEALTGALCPCCGRVSPAGLAERGDKPLCPACRRGVYGFDCARSFAVYNDTMHGAIVL